MQRSKVRGGLVGKLRRIAQESQTNIFLDHWIQLNVTHWLEKAAARGKLTTDIEFTPRMVSELAKVGCNMDQFKSRMFKDNVDCIELRGNKDFDELEANPDNITLRFSW